MKKLFKRAYEEVRIREKAKGQRWSKRRLVEMTIRETQPPFYCVAFETTLDVVANLHKFSMANTDLTPRRQMWLEIAAKVDAMMGVPLNMGRCKAVQHVLTFERPSRWFISVETGVKWAASWPRA